MVIEKSNKLFENQDIIVFFFVHPMLSIHVHRSYTNIHAFLFDLLSLILKMGLKNNYNKWIKVAKHHPHIDHLVNKGTIKLVLKKFSTLMYDVGGRLFATEMCKPDKTIIEERLTVTIV